MKVKAIDTVKLGDWKTWYIADQLGITNQEASTLKAGKVVEIKTAAITSAAGAIRVLLKKVKEPPKDRSKK